LRVTAAKTRGYLSQRRWEEILPKKWVAFFTTLSFARWLAGNPCGGLSKEESL